MDQMQCLCSWVTIGSTGQSVLKPLLCVAMAYMTLGSLWGVVVSAALAAGVSMVSILQAGGWATVSMLAIHYFSTYITTTDQHQGLCAVCCTGHE